MIMYFDTSAVIKRYATEQGTDWVRSFFTPPATNQVYTSQITLVEVAAGLQRKVRSRALPPRYAQKALQTFLDDVTSGDYVIVPLNNTIINLAVQLTQHHPLRAYDALHLATTKQISDTLQQANLSPATFVCADTRLLEAAQKEAQLVANPNQH